MKNEGIAFVHRSVVLCFFRRLKVGTGENMNLDNDPIIPDVTNIFSFWTPDFVVSNLIR